MVEFLGIPVDVKLALLGAGAIAAIVLCYYGFVMARRSGDTSQTQVPPPKP